jgi:deazaflavin-dependent oxidoreductase (nitroreductase family)
MPLNGEYEPSKAQFVRDQVELYESSGGTQGTTLSVLVTRGEDEHLRDLPVVILTTLGAKSGKIRKTPLMRVEHNGLYAVVASMAGAPQHPVWYHNVVADPRVELQDGPVRRDMRAREVSGEEKALWWPEPSRRSRTTPSTRRKPTGRSRFSFWNRFCENTDDLLINL